MRRKKKPVKIANMNVTKMYAMVEVDGSTYTIIVRDCSTMKEAKKHVEDKYKMKVVSVSKERPKKLERTAEMVKTGYRGNECRTTKRGIGS